MRLYDLGKDLEAIYAELEATDGELTPDLAERLESVSGAFEEKVERIALLIRQMDADAGVAADEGRRLTAKAKSAERGALELKRYLMQWMERVGRDSVKRPLASPRIQLGPPSVDYTGPVEALPEDLVRVKPEERSLDAKKALEWHREGRTLPDGIEVVRNRFLRIY